jgi:hypothetical protein
MKKLAYAFGVFSLALLFQQVEANTEIATQQAQYQDEARCNKPAPRCPKACPRTLFQESQKTYVDVINPLGSSVLPGANVIFDNSVTSYYPIDASQASSTGAITILARGDYLIVFSLTELSLSGTSFGLYINNKQVGRSYNEFTLTDALEVNLKEGDVITLRNNGFQQSLLTAGTLSISKVVPVRR